jgi:hypothetical protein
MPVGSVTITFPKNRLVYINGDYNPDSPKRIQCTYVVDYGENIFETLNGTKQVDYRAKVVTDVSNPDCQIALTRVP